MELLRVLAVVVPALEFSHRPQMTAEFGFLAVEVRYVKKLTHCAVMCVIPGLEKCAS
jgi:hypothetical protein